MSVTASFMASIIIGTITGTLILDKTRKAHARISWLGSWKSSSFNLLLQKWTVYLIILFFLNPALLMLFLFPLATKLHIPIWGYIISFHLLYISTKCTFISCDMTLWHHSDIEHQPSTSRKFTLVTKCQVIYKSDIAPSIPQINNHTRIYINTVEEFMESLFIKMKSMISTSQTWCII